MLAQCAGHRHIAPTHPHKLRCPLYQRFPPVKVSYLVERGQKVLAGSAVLVKETALVMVPVWEQAHPAKGGLPMMTNGSGSFHLHAGNIVEVA
jgi:hypothetical protein